MNTAQTTIISDIEADMYTIREDGALYEEANFNRRADAIDFIDFHIIDRIKGLLQNATSNVELSILLQQAERLKCSLEQINAGLFKQLRQSICAGTYTKSAFCKMVGYYTGYEVNHNVSPGSAGYDNLDVFINGLLCYQPVPKAKKEPRPEMVCYQKTPARIIFEMAMELREDDVFFDIGSGLGQAAILVNLICGAAAKGIEYEPAYCDYAAACALQLNLPNIEFVNADARTADYSTGAVFFM